MSMKDHIRREIERAARELDLSLRPLSDERSLEIRSRLARAFGKEPDRAIGFSYQVLDDYAAFYSTESWKLAPQSLEASPVLFFVNPDEALTVWELDSSRDVLALLAESFGFPFYIASPDLEAMVCVDDHDCLYGVGGARDAVRDLKKA